MHRLGNAIIAANSMFLARIIAPLFHRIESGKICRLDTIALTNADAACPS